MKNLYLLIIIASGLSVTFPACDNKTKANAEYYCPMHPEVVQDEPGNCPKCNMKLEKREKVSRAEESTK